MVAILYPRRLRELLDVDQPGGIGLPDQGVPVLHSSNSSFVIQTIAAGGGGSFSLGASNLGNTLGQTGVTGSRVVLAGIGNLTLSQLTDANGGTISISAGTAGAGFSAGVSGGNTAGDTGATGTRLVLAGGNNITLSQATDLNGGSVTISGPNTVAQSVQTQNLFDLTISGNTAGVGALVSSGTLTLAGGNNITLSQAGNAITISGPSPAGAQTAISGISASDTLYTSGTVRFTGVGGGVTVSSNTGQRIDISVAAPVAQTGTQFSAGISGGNTSGHSGTVAGRVVFAGGNNITLSGSTNGVSETITISAFNQTTQTQNLHNVTLSGNTAGVMAQISSGTMTLAGGNNITLSQNGNAVTISAGAAGGGSFSAGVSTDGNTAGATGVSGTRMVLVGEGVMTLSQTTGAAGNTVSIQAPATSVLSAVAPLSTSTNGSTISILGPAQFSAGFSTPGNTAGDTGFVTGRLAFVGSNGITLSGSTNAGSQTITISGATQTVQTQNMVAVTLSGNTSGAQALISSGTLTLAGGNNITVSQAGNAVTISGPNVGGAQTGISGLANSETTYTSGSVTFSALGAITIRSTTGQHFQFSVNSQTVQTQSLFSAGVSTGGNTAGDTGITGTRMVFVGSNNITLSQATAAAGGTITISGPTTVAQTDQTGGVYAVGNTYSSSSGTYDARSISIRGDGIISVAATNSGWRISASQSVQPETQTFLGGIAASDKTYTSGTVVLTGAGGGITVQSNAGQTITLSVAAPVAQTGTQFSGGLSNIGNTAGDTGTVAGRLVLAGGNGITLSGSTNGVSETITVSGITQSVQTQNVHNVTLSGNTAGVMAHISSGTMTLAGGNNITLSQAGNAVTISGGAGGGYSAGVSNVGNSAGDTGVTGTRMVLAGGNNVTLSQATDANGNTVTVSAFNQTVESQSIGASNLGNTLGTSGVASGGQVRMVIIGTSNITVSQSLNGASGTMSLIGQPSFSAGVSTGGNTQGNTGVSGTRLVLVGTNNITLSQNTDANGATISISGQSPAGGAFSGGVSTMGNTAGATGITGTQLVLVGTNAISLSQTTGANGGTVSIDAPATSSLIGTNGVTISTNGSTISVMLATESSFAPFAESPIVTGAQGQATLHIAPVKVPNISFDRMGLGMQISNATNSSNSITISGWVGFYTKNASTISLLASTSVTTNFTGSGGVGSYSLYGGPKWLTIPWTTTLTGSDYYVGIVIRSTTGGGAGHTVSQLLISKFTNSAWSGVIGVGTNATDQAALGLGVYTVSTAGMPNSIGFTQINGSGSLVVRAPIWQLRSGTV